MTDEKVAQDVDVDESPGALKHIEKVVDNLCFHFGDKSITRDNFLKSPLKTIFQPAVDDLFEIIRDPGDVQGAVFRTEPTRNFAPYHVPYIAARESVEDVQAVLYESLMVSCGALLVQGSAGIGKTREVAELATRLCKEGWTVCVAKGQGDAWIDTPKAIPDDLRGGRLLFVLDDLHLRANSELSGQQPYLDRLNAFFEFFRGNRTRGEMCIIATARTERHDQKQSGFDFSHSLMSTFSVYNLPKFLKKHLCFMLAKLANQAKLDLNKDHIEDMISNSDQTPRTVVLNVNRARQRGEALTAKQWLPNQEKLWKKQFQEAGGRWPTVESAYEALYIIRKAGLPTRINYVAELGTRLAGGALAPAVKGLIDMGLFGVRGILIDVFSDEEFQNNLQDTGKTAPKVEDHWTLIIEALKKQVEKKPEWSGDLVTLASKLFLARNREDAEATATAAIIHNKGNPYAYVTRAVARLMQSNYAGAEEDLNAAIQKGEKRAASYSLRAVARYVQRNYAGVEEDLNAAIKKGEERAASYSLRAVARYVQRNYAGVEEDLNTAIEKGKSDADVYLLRAKARFEQDNYAKAEQDLNIAIKKEENNATAYLMRAFARLEQGNYAKAEQDFNIVIEKEENNADAFYMRSKVRLRQGNYAGAEKDLSTAIQKGKNTSTAYLMRGWTRLKQGNFAGSEKDLSTAIQKGADNPTAHLMRSWARQEQGNNN